MNGAPYSQNRNPMVCSVWLTSESRVCSRYRSLDWLIVKTAMKSEWNRLCRKGLRQPRPQVTFELLPPSEATLKLAEQKALYMKKLPFVFN
ncbi:unnamed protein product [Bursaphelenchus xylophilus]|uniref:(pine wood nematode) hypothetical protein n=1 Tax=Bursaphelenchus xylophilus TaxID=6326 RepID=A0A1I7RW10_BURXY|nr:unnamed protein product [Bursaphelenchus xylophilus]CAG9094986.1 unnamed protein product [Bursaphelenchus xylophilus]